MGLLGMLGSNPEIYTYPPFAILLLYYYGVRQPFREIDFLY